MHKEQLKKLNSINEKYKLLKKIEPFIVFKHYKVFFLSGIIFLPFFDFFMFIVNKVIKDEIYTYLNNSNETIFYLFGSLLLLYLMVSTFILVLITYSSYYFTIKNFKKMKLKK